MDKHTLSKTERGAAWLLFMIAAVLAYFQWMWLSGLFVGIAGGALQLWRAGVDKHQD